MSNKFLKFLKFSQLTYWTAKRYFAKELQLTNKYPKVLMGFFLSKSQPNIINIKDEDQYKIIGVRSYGKGAYINRKVAGQQLTMKKYQLAKANQLIWCKVDTKNGAFGIVNDELANSYASSNMCLVDIDNSKILNQYLQLLFTSQNFQRYLDSFVSGTTNRKYIKLDELLNSIEVPLPPIEKQREIVEKYNAKIKLAEEQEQKAENLEKEIEKIFELSLGLNANKVCNVVQKNKFLKFLKFKNLTRWDALSQNSDIDNILNTSMYPLINLGQHYNFVNRSWNKKNCKQKNFKYIEIGAIDPIKGITQIKEILVSEAPSRATQIVKHNDLIIGTTRPYLKKFAIVSIENDGDICSSGFSVIENSNKYNIDYLKEFLMSQFGIEQLKNKMTGGLYPAINLDELKSIKIPLPNLTEQDNIMEQITKLKKEIKFLKEHSEQNRIVAKEEFEKELFE